MPATLALPAVLTAIVAKLVADTTLAGLVANAPAGFGGKGIYNVVPQTALRPYLVVDAGTEVPFNTMGSGAKWGGNCVVQLKAVTDAESDLPGLTILSRAKVVLDGQPLTVSGYPTAIVQWETTLPTYPEVVGSFQVGGVQVRHCPALVRVFAHESA